MATQNAAPAVRAPGASPSLPWWAQPVATMVVLGVFGLYSIWEVLFHSSGQYQNYLSPFFSPDVRVLGIHFIPALWVIWVPLGIRGTCYYYRKAYYRSFFWDPLACARPEGRGRAYQGETVWPYLLNNLHRYFIYLGFIVLLFLWWDAIRAFFFPSGFGVGLGSLIMLANVILLSMYTLSCHSVRHLVGGRLDCFSCPNGRPLRRYVLWQRISEWNERHSLWAWLSLASVWLTDLYIRLLIMGVIKDVRFF